MNVKQKWQALMASQYYTRQIMLLKNKGLNLLYYSQISTAWIPGVFDKTSRYPGVQDNQICLPFCFSGFPDDFIHVHLM